MMTVKTEISNIKKRLRRPAQVAVTQCLNVKKREKVLIVANHEQLSIAETLYNEVLRVGGHPTIMLYPEGKINGEEPPELVSLAMFHSDAVLAPTGKSISHTEARRKATGNGHTRIATLPGITEEVFIRGLSADYFAIAKLTRRVHRYLNKAKKARLTSPSGTDLELDIDNPADIGDGNIRKKGSFTNLPDGETELAPRSANGILVVDCAGEFITEPTRIEIKNGYIVHIENSRSGKRFARLLQNAKKRDRNKNAYFIAEFAIGTNPTAKVTGCILEDEKVLGTCHIAFGDNTSFPGGKNHSVIHIDTIVIRPSIWLDEKIIMKKGELLI